MKLIRQNGVSLGDFNSGRYDGRRVKSTMLADIESNPLYKPAARNGYRGDFPLNGLVVYTPAYLFKSLTFPTIDRYGHECTRVGATWDGKSWIMDGTDDHIIVAHHASFNFTKDTPFTLISWVKSSTDAAQALIAKHDGVSGYFTMLDNGTAAGELRLLFSLQKTGTKFVSGDTDLIDGLYHLCSATYDGSNTIGGLKLQVDGIAESLTTSDGSLGDITIANDMWLGERGDNILDLTGSMGEQWVYNKVLSVGEVTHIYNNTKWRYL